MTKKVYIDTTVLKFSATQLPRYRPRTQKINWGGHAFETTVNDLVYINPNESIKNPELKVETELLPILAEAGKAGIIKFVIQLEALIESWGIPKMKSETGTFYDAPYEYIEAPVKYSRTIAGGSLHPKEMQFRFLSSLKHKRFFELQKLTGAYQGIGKLNRNQLLDAFHLWCAEYNGCDYFLTLDFKLIRVIGKQKGRFLCAVVKPSELMSLIR
jgi:hypothetical protein